VRALSFVILGGLLLLLPSPARAGGHALDPAQIEAARSPEQHDALARGFQDRATEAKQLAEDSRAMSKAYARTDAADRMVKAAHCQQLATEYEELAREYQALAEIEQASAKR